MIIQQLITRVDGSLSIHKMVQHPLRNYLTILGLFLAESKSWSRQIHPQTQITIIFSMELDLLKWMPLPDSTTVELFLGTIQQMYPFLLSSFIPHFLLSSFLYDKLLQHFLLSLFFILDPFYFLLSHLDSFVVPNGQLWAHNKRQRWLGE